MKYSHSFLIYYLKPYDNRRNELSCEQDCVVWGSRVIIPPIFRAKMLGQLHWEHPGISGKKAIARTCMWWPKMDQEIEEAERVCTVCQNVRNDPPSAPLIPWNWPTRPFLLTQLLYLTIVQFSLISLRLIIGFFL